MPRVTREQFEAALAELHNAKYDTRSEPYQEVYRHHPRLHRPTRGRPPIVTLCGSTRFRDDFEAEMRRLTLEGCIVVSVGLFGHMEGLDMGTDEAPSETKAMLDELHLRKIDLADRVHVVNPGGYVGHSTAREVAYAERTGKPVSYLTDPCHSKGTEAEYHPPIHFNADEVGGDPDIYSKAAVGRTDTAPLTPEQRAEYVATVRDGIDVSQDAMVALDALIADAELTREAMDVLAIQHVATLQKHEVMDNERAEDLVRIVASNALTEAARRLGRASPGAPLG